jgi:spore maturation protein CgeB
LEVQLLHDQNFIRINEGLRSQIDVHKKKSAELNEGLRSQIDVHKKKSAELNEELKERSGQCAQLKSRNEQLSQDLARAETSYIEAMATLRSPAKVTRFYLRALARRLGLIAKAKDQKEKSAASVQAPAPGTASKISSTSKKVETETGEKAAAPKAVQQIVPDQRVLRRTVKSLKELKIASILDTFSHSCFEPEASLLPITPANWKEVFQEEEVDFLFVESAWNGNDGAWQYRIASYANPAGSELDELILWCNSQDIPTVFWNKEDPPNFDRFIQTAVKFDYIFTTDENCVPAYQARCGHDRIYPLMFAAQPAIHNPISSTERKNKVCFAGTYYADCFPERRRQMESLLAGSVPYGLEIYDRMHGHSGPDSQRYLFPEQFVPYIQGRLSYEDMLKAYKEYRVFLNVNSVQDSPTMFARRVFELLACGTPVVSTPSEGISQVFGDLVPQAATVNETRAALEALMGDEEAWYKQSIRGLRHVMESHCYEHRLQEIATKLGVSPASAKPKIFLIVDVGDGSPELIAEQILAQQHRPDGVFVRQKSDIEETRQQTFETLQKLLTAQGIAVDVYGSSATIQKLQEEEQDAFFALWDGTSVYGPQYLLDALHALYYSGASLTAMSDSFRMDDQGALCKPSQLTLSAQKSAYKAGPFCPLKSSFSEHIIAATLTGKMEELFEFPVSRIASAEAIGLGVHCHIRHPFGFLCTTQNTEPLPDEISAQIFV